MNKKSFFTALLAMTRSGRTDNDRVGPRPEGAQLQEPRVATRGSTPAGSTPINPAP